MPQTGRVRRPLADLLPDGPGRVVRETPPRPPLKWAGGKRWQIPHLRPLWDAHRDKRLVEPFCGGLAVAVTLTPSRALLNDVNPHVINFYGWLKRGLKTDIVMENDETTYYANRVRFNELLANGRADCAEAAALFYYLNRTGYNGLCRFNQQGEFNVPFGRYTRLDYRKDFTGYIAAFNDTGAQWFLCRSACSSDAVAHAARPRCWNQARRNRRRVMSAISASRSRFR